VCGLTVLWFKCCALQVRALAEFGDLPENVDLIVLQQLPNLPCEVFIEVPTAAQRTPARAAAVAPCAFDCDETTSLCAQDKVSEVFVRIEPRNLSPSPSPSPSPAPSPFPAPASARSLSALSAPDVALIVRAAARVRSAPPHHAPRRSQPEEQISRATLLPSSAAASGAA
jgi:hypothetical protein